MTEPGLYVFVPNQMSILEGFYIDECEVMLVIGTEPKDEIYNVYRVVLGGEYREILLRPTELRRVM